MSRQDANAAFALSSFLDGANAGYIDELYARFQDEPRLGRSGLAGILQEPERPPGRHPEGGLRPVLGQRQLAAHARATT